MKIKKEKAPEGSKENPIVPHSIAGMLTNKRYHELRVKVGLRVVEIAALCMMHERGQFPGNLLFTSNRRRDFLNPIYKKLLKKTKKEVDVKFHEMQAEMKASLARSKKKLEKQGVDFEKAGKEELRRKQKEVARIKKIVNRGVAKHGKS